MARINNSDTIKRILDDAKIQTAIDNVPQELASKVVPVLIANPLRVVNVTGNGTKLTTGQYTIYTTPSDKDFYLTNASLHNQSDATADNTFITLDCTMKGQNSANLLRMGKITLTAFSGSISHNYFNPILLERGTTISLNTTFTAGVSQTDATIQGYAVGE